jgi:hypothetical protein
MNSRDREQRPAPTPPGEALRWKPSRPQQCKSSKSNAEGRVKR